MLKILLLISTLIGIGLVDYGQLTTEFNDKLVYVVSQYEDGFASGSSVMVYNPVTDVTSIIYESDNWLNFQVSTNGVVALASRWEDSSEILLVDINASDQQPVNLSQLVDLTGQPLGWSADGRFLAFTSYENAERSSIYIWDGEMTTDITPDTTLGDPQRYEVAWSNDGRLAFTVGFGFRGDSPRSEIYLWDGSSTYNLSQNPLGVDRAPTWSSTNQLAFLSERDGQYGVYVWDGMTFAEGIPDVTSFDEIASEVTYYESYPVWTNADDLAFKGSSPEDEHIQIYLWDGNVATNISQNPNAHNSGPRWADNGYWAFVTFFSDEQSIFIRDQENNTVLSTDGQYIPAWSSTAALIFCRRGSQRSNWVLSIWNGKEIVELSEGGEILAQWQSGQETVCSSG